MRKSRKTIVIVMICILMMSLSFTAGAYSARTKVSAWLAKDITVLFNGTAPELRDGAGEKVYPLVYNGSTYLPLRAVSNLVGLDTDWDSSTQTVMLTSSGDNPSEPVKDGQNYTGGTGSQQPAPTTPTTPSAPTTSASGTMESPVPLNQKFTWAESYEYLGKNTKATFSATVKSVREISLDDIENLGFRRPENDSRVKYVMINLAYEVSNGTHDGENYLSLAFEPQIWGAKGSDGTSVIGGNDYGFDGALTESIESAIESTYGDEFIKTTAGKTYSYKAEGKILLAIPAASTPYLVIGKKDSSLEYEKSLVYFKLN